MEAIEAVVAVQLVREQEGGGEHLQVNDVGFKSNACRPDRPGI